MLEQSDRNNHVQKKGLVYTLLKIIAFGIGIFLIAWFVSKSNPSEIGEQLVRINIGFFLLIIVTFIAYMMVAIGWYQSFPEKPGTLSILYLFIIRQIGETLSQINPTNLIAGETLKVMLLKHRGISYHDSIVSLTISRVSIVLSAITLIIAGAIVFFDELLKMGGHGSSSYTIPLLISLVIIIIALIYYMMRKGKGILYLPILILEVFEKKFGNHQKLKNVIEKMKLIDAEILDFFKNKKNSFLLIYLLSLFHWVVGAVEMYIILQFIGFNVSLLSCVAVEVGVMVFKALGAFVPGQLGIEEMANKLMLEFINVSGSSVWITVSILRRARQLFWILVGFTALFFVLRHKKELNNGSVVCNS